jgi:type IV pilus assembly protein PilB
VSKQLAEMLVRDRVVTAAQFIEAAQASDPAKGGKGYARYFIEKKYVAETKLLYYLSQKYGLPSINIAKFEIPPEMIKLVPSEMARKGQIIPIQSNKGTLVVALCDPTVMSGLEKLKFVTKMNVEAVLTSYSAFDAAMSKYYSVNMIGSAVESYQKDIKGGGETKDSGLELVQVHDIDAGSTEQDAPVIQLVNGILAEGIKLMASDIHVEPYEKRFRVRMRVDGVLSEVTAIPNEMKRAVLARFKIMSRMDIAESRVPQDGRIKLKLGGQEIDFRVNTMPTLFGEKVVLRMLSKGNLQLDMMKLGFETKQLETFKRGIYAPNGLVLVTGPTGSGKTTTLYSALAELNQITENLSTAEDPVEYNLEGINQVQVHKEIGLSFASVLRALLRQDPDIILVGEIRDYETAEVAVQAALTGHLVLSTLHTNDAPSTITRLMNMGLEPFLVVASVNTIVGQRLMRTVCASCKAEIKIPKEELQKLGVGNEEILKAKFFKGQGCDKCNKTGYKGRVAIYEVLEFSQTLKEMVLRGESIIDLKKQAVKEGMKSLRMAALSKVIEGRTTLEEALSLTMEN